MALELEDVLFQVFSHLRVFDVAKNTMLVSHLWNSCSNENMLWKHFFDRDFSDRDGVGETYLEKYKDAYCIQFMRSTTSINIVAPRTILRILPPSNSSWGTAVCSKVMTRGCHALEFVLECVHNAQGNNTLVGIAPADWKFPADDTTDTEYSNFMAAYHGFAYATPNTCFYVRKESGPETLTAKWKANSGDVVTVFVNLDTRLILFALNGERMTEQPLSLDAKLKPVREFRFAVDLSDDADRVTIRPLGRNVQWPDDML
eukprot:TRINITY_DN156_c0_g1_i1.p1 TRINITY_DN156_c0_g1~~TRINITY_DN156_c0_g1_i1.p1  ORF type:complete len:259 (-),score=46.99 TRINITY_DN156_c0_g1_i1:757-1533(-)